MPWSALAPGAEIIAPDGEPYFVVNVAFPVLDQTIAQVTVEKGLGAKPREIRAARGGLAVVVVRELDDAVRLILSAMPESYVSGERGSGIWRGPAPDGGRDGERRLAEHARLFHAQSTYIAHTSKGAALYRGHTLAHQHEGYGGVPHDHV